MGKLIKDFVITFAIGVGVVLLVYWIGYVPPNPRIFNAVDKITFTHFFENRIYDNWLMIAFLFAIVVTVIDAGSSKKEEK
ncbi:hypothetical protein [Staphylococcus intermedius]|uniref:Uncharacterized protein n=1 Tax=Staphylococcus intermedius NCTC 11048 TaxID=1141106 RepID=A0A380G974_STAIN|nr:hypothetical protein [Staphylococcus intermedius]PCF65054.1 hypothetical protein B5C04_03100 [Staphylococcus intermedius]PCF80665.1 hypothetical protein B4W74_03120 [Staphylococcus intermedius]PCF82014.1 hypothetical protein B4W70_03100 [Staphylococcus intermedius]PCF88350.1 hypothetical protein B4W75_06145 [Staphylococcus intermedius]PCF89065.1 hypothetical protein B4W76_02140 [Staphylococcus intermedius]